MTFLTSQTDVVAFEDISRLPMVKCLWIPLDDGEGLAVVLGVATHALFARVWVEVIGGVQSLSIDKTGSDLGVAIQTLEVGLACSEPVTSGAVRGAVQRLMRTGKRARRDLRRRGANEKQKCTCNDLKDQATFAWSCHLKSAALFAGTQSIPASLGVRKVQEV